jgi:hypothetical protein
MGALAEKQRAMADALKKRQVLGRGQNEPPRPQSGSSKMPKMANIKSAEEAAESKLNRHQRRAMKKLGRSKVKPGMGDE